jgi:1-acyl-sn-glycerol-3-phosphate acyltransferase
VTAVADCEARDTWFLEQDVNAWSSVAYVAAGVVLAVEVVRRRLPRHVGVFAGILAVEGVGSVLYHGAAGDAAQLVHDAPLVGALGYVAGWHVGRLAGRTGPGAVAGAAIGLVVGTVAWASTPGLVNVAAAAAVALIVIASLLARRRRLPAVWTAPVLVLLVVAGAAWAAGSESSVLCSSASWWQFHALWHVLTAIVAVAWVDVATAAEDPDGAPRLFRRATDRVIGVLAVGLVLVFHRSIDVVGRDRLPHGRPVLVVANHANGFVDPVVVAALLRRLPRFLAKAALWKVVPARPLLALAGVLPVYRASDGDRTADNVSVFDACHRELAQRATVGIFPEGTTGDRGGLDRIRSGAARIALGAVPSAPDTVIVPIGLAYEDRVVTRSRLAVMVGEPIAVLDEVAAGIGPDGEPDHGDVDRLTDRITRALEAVAPDFASVEQRDALRAAARVHLRGTGPPPSFGAAETLARRLATADEPARDAVMEAYRRYATRVHLAGLRDDQRGRPSLARLVLSAVVLAVAGPLLLTATLIHLPALVLVTTATGLVRSTATKGTVRLLVGLVTLLVTWSIAGWLLADGLGAFVAAVAVALGGAGALAVWSPVVAAVRTVGGWLRVRDRVGLLPPIDEARDDLDRAVTTALGTAP